MDTTMYDKMSPDELFTQMLQIFKNPTDDFSRESQNMMPFKYYIQDLFRSLEFGQYPMKVNKIVAFVKLIDKHGLSVLGYILLTDKHDALVKLYLYVKFNSDIQAYISSTLNRELASVLAYYPNKISVLIDRLKTIKQQYVPSFQLNVENAKLIGYMMAKDAFKTIFDFPDIVRPFEVPDQFVPYIAPPPLPPPQHYAQPPPPQQYAHQYAQPQQYAHQYAQPPPPPGFRFGGTIKAHKRHKKQMRKHASKKIKHA